MVDAGIRRSNELVFTINDVRPNRSIVLFLELPPELLLFTDAGNDTTVAMAFSSVDVLLDSWLVDGCSASIMSKEL